MEIQGWRVRSNGGEIGVDRQVEIGEVMEMEKQSLRGR